ncbi:nucleic acid-binding protein [Annulohypoxylon truncatum]|uniref:nucleic acid-binding protein n=1 Tax=Annulohypoxylon truncatum TaxID=327061 RepID=UPI00200847F9|nr:nucleic acid-binding protein [Annulohypoxylon truncatum]KAI1207390.1 nucleic acid-binding protein [Annulohypoxylon truncatum]
MVVEVVAAAANTTRQVAKEMLGVVVSAGLMDKTVKVKLGGFRWEPKVQKYFKEPRFKLVHDPRNSVRQGDIVAITPTWRVSQHVRHVVKHIIAPYGEPIDERPPIPTLEERLAEAAAKRAAKDERRAFLKQIQTAIRDAERIALEVKKALRTSRKLGIYSAQPAETTTIDDVD